MSKFVKVVVNVCVMIMVVCATIAITHLYDMNEAHKEYEELMDDMYSYCWDLMEEHQDEIDSIHEDYQYEIDELKEENADLSEQLSVSEAMVDMMENILYDYEIEIELVKY